MELLVRTEIDPCYIGLGAYRSGKPGVSSPLATTGAKGIRSLSDREIEVLRELAKGLGNRGIARSLVISEKTVERHLENIYNKLDITSRISAVVYAIKNGLVD